MLSQLSSVASPSTRQVLVLVSFVLFFSFAEWQKGEADAAVMGWKKVQCCGNGKNKIKKVKNLVQKSRILICVFWSAWVLSRYEAQPQQAQPLMPLRR